MYKLEILPVAKKDMDNIIYYVSHNLKNNKASNKLMKNFINATKKILLFPYGAPEYYTNKKQKLENTYRCLKIQNFLMFYLINEQDKLITIVRVLYNKMNIYNILE